MAEARALSAADLTALCDFQTLCFDPPWSEALLRRQLQKPDGLNLGLYDGGELIAFALCSRLFDEAELLQIAVLPQRRREGLGRRLLEDMMSRLACDGCQRLLLEVRASNAAALSLYRILGMQEDGRRRGYYSSASGTEDALLMSKTFTG
ncbi:MAG: ribosomal protein S18-alanine N-acetyltransferase [Oceanospirillaceae bacterium]|nr:ribosomal protein S18-alanine N-acetyltransferase [Oceanospirillaceae bacterium]